METKDIVSNLISNIVDDNVTQAKDDFEAVISAKLASAIEDKKQEVAQSIYVNSEEEDTEDEDPALLSVLLSADKEDEQCSIFCFFNFVFE